ncbi:unnamed protein product, partial [Prorocentrum cordatum]
AIVAQAFWPTPGLSAAARRAPSQDASPTDRRADRGRTRRALGSAAARPMPPGEPHQRGGGSAAQVEEAPPDTVHVLLPEGMGLHEVTSMFHRFGEVSCLEMVPGDQLVLAVVFFDSRAAAAALGALCPALCWPGGHRGRRRVPSGSRAGVVGVAGVSGERAGAEVEDNEFYDVRDAARFRMRFGGGAATAEAAAGPSRAASWRPVPAYVVPTREVAQIASNAAQAVLVEGLPSMVATEQCFPVVLQQAGLGGLYRAFEVWGGTPCGGALVMFHCHAAELCVRHFHGCQWDPCGQPVTARPLAPELAAEELAARGRPRAAAALRAAAAGAPRAHPWGLPAKVGARALVEERGPPRRAPTWGRPTPETTPRTGERGGGRGEAGRGAASGAPCSGQARCPGIPFASFGGCQHLLYIGRSLLWPGVLPWPRT